MAFFISAVCINTFSSRNQLYGIGLSFEAILLTGPSNKSKYLSRVIVSNSIPQDINMKKCNKLEVFDISELLGEVSKRILNGNSISELFSE